MNNQTLHAIKPALNLLAAFALLALTACGSGGGGAAPSTDATLSNIQLSDVTLDQLFQSSQTSYTASSGFLKSAVQATVTLTDSKASVKINGVTADSGATSAPISLAEGDNTINIVVTAEDGVTTQTYSIVVTRQLAASFAQRAYLKGRSVGEDDQFSRGSMALDGDTLVVGASNTAIAAGAVYVFTRDSNGDWSQQADLRAFNAEAGDLFGFKVAISGDTLVVGALEEDGGRGTNFDNTNNSATDSGAVYVFIRDNNGNWNLQDFIKASNANAGDEFSTSVALEGDTLVVGARFEDSIARDSGAVYVFTRDSNGDWSEQAMLKVSNAGTNDYFGHSVALEGDTLVVGASFEDGDADSTADNPNDNAPFAGAVYVFTGSGANWSQQAYLKASNAGDNDQFGQNVALSGDILVVGVPRENGDGDASLDSGAAYVFTRSGAAWSEQSILRASNVGARDRFGTSVAVDGDTLVVGAFLEDGDGDVSQDSGAVYVFTRSGAAWSEQSILRAGNVGAEDRFGHSVALDGDTLVVGAHFENGDASSTMENPNRNSFHVGAVYVFQ